MSYLTSVDRNSAVDIGDIAEQYEVRLTLTLQDRISLWSAAAAKLRAIGLVDEDIADCIGTHADISTEDCLATLMTPMTLQGCTLTDITTTALLPELDRLLRAASEAFQQIEAQAFPVQPRFSADPMTLAPNPVSYFL